MKILVTDGAAADAPNVQYWPELAGAPEDDLIAALGVARPDALVTRNAVGAQVMAAWRSDRPDAVLLLVDLAPDDAEAGHRDACRRHRIGWLRAEHTTDALRVAERHWHDAVCAARWARLRATSPPARSTGGESVTLVGAGVVNLVTALRLVEAGYRVEFCDRAPDPRDDARWTAYGYTRGGGDGRMFTLTEMDSYNNRSEPSSDGTSGLLARPVSRGGWLVADPGGLSAPEHRWAERFHRMPPWLADSYGEDILAVSQVAAKRWCALIDASPGLFSDATGYRENVLRLYTDETLFRAQVRRNAWVGAVERVLTPGQIREDHPALADACANGTVVGGIEVLGFTVNIHRFVGQLIDKLEEIGAKFRWNTQVEGIHWHWSGVVDGLRTARGETVRGRHYVLSPGAYGGRLLRGTASHGRIQGMLGVWFTLPNPEPRLEHSVKIARAGHTGEETNITLGTDPDGAPVLICGAGYGWTGVNPTNIAPAELAALHAALEDTLRRVFPRAHALALDTGALTERRLCVRPWTASCLGVFEQVPTVDGGTLIVTGGHNTGGFAQAPVIADAVLDALQNREHPMHTRYHPQRLEHFYATD